VATPTLAKSPNPHQFLPKLARPFAPPSHPKPQFAFCVFPTGKAVYPWRIAALATNQTVSFHKSLRFALSKCTRLNQWRGKGARNETN
jgi:hypothetical protein